MNMKIGVLRHCLTATMLLILASGLRADTPFAVYEGGDGPGKGKHIVLISGDEEYRSEEALPQLGKNLAKHHGFKCTVLFAIDPSDGTIDPKNTKNIPGLEALKDADLMILFTRFRDLPDEQMKYIVDYVDSGRPILGMRTATHAFNFRTSKTYAKYSAGGNREWKGGFGRQILGETWVNHWGHHGRESTSGILVKNEKDNPILRGINDGDIWGPTDVYEVHLGDECKSLVLGQVLAGMKPNDSPVQGKKNEPMMPIAWTKTYKSASGKMGRVFTTTMGASQDLQSEGLRRLLVNAAYWTIGMEDKIPAKSNVELIGEYKPLPFGFGGFKKGVKPSDLAIKMVEEPSAHDRVSRRVSHELKCRHFCRKVRRPILLATIGPADTFCSLYSGISRIMRFEGAVVGSSLMSSGEVAAVCQCDFGAISPSFCEPEVTGSRS